ncbi:MAG: hypothetical protein GKS06_12700 [Acidobacteria bacterium]|nr:hypothetical protein [Acidobacteriota bacterium]
MITDVAEYFSKGCGRCERFATADCSTRRWEAGLQRLRSICLDMGLTETAKWGHPCYTHDGRNVAIIGAHREDFQLSFFDAALMKDPAGVLEKPGPNTQYPCLLRFAADVEVAEMEPTIRAYLEECVGYVKAGVKPPKTRGEVELPSELVEALDSDRELAEAFHALTPGRQRSYAINLSSAKKSTTRISRIAKFRDKIIAGKGALER